MIFNPFWRGARTPQVKSFTPDETLEYNTTTKILSAVPGQAPYGSGTSTGSNTGDQIAATVPFDDGVAMLGETNVQGAIEAVKALIGGAGTGDVVGPGSATDLDFVQFDGTTGKLIKDGGLSRDTDGGLTANSDSRIATQKAVKSYVDAVAQGLSIRDSCLLATAAALPTVVYANGSSGVGATLTGFAVGAISIDGTSLAVNDRVLIKDQAAPLQNGIYTCTATGSGIAVFVLTRSLDYDQAADILSGTFTFIEEGTVNTGAGFVMTTVGAITVGTTAINWTQFSGAGEITVDASLTKSGNQLGRAALTGDVTASAGSNATTIPADTVTNAQLANQTAYSLKANLTSGAANPTDAVYTDFTTKSTPAGPDFVVGFDSTGVPKKYTISSFAGSGGAVGPGTGIYEARGTHKPVVADSYTWSNQGSCSVADGTNAFIFTAPTNGASDSLRIQYLATPGTPFSVYMRFRTLSQTLSFTTFGLIFRNSTSGRLLTYAIHGTGSAGHYQQMIDWSSVTGFHATINGLDQNVYDPGVWLRCDVTSTTVTPYISYDGWNWNNPLTTVYTISSYLTATGGSLDGYGFFCNPNGATGGMVTMIYDFSTTAPT